MTELEKEKVEKYLKGTATPEEAEWVLNWFETKEGKRFLDRRINRDLKQIHALYPYSDTATRTLEKIKSQMDSQPKKSAFGGRLFRRQIFAWAAALLIVFSASVFTYFMQKKPLVAVEANESFGKHIYSTGNNEHRLLTLSDGTRIRLNENSRLKIPESYPSDEQTVILNGEAFFEVAEDSSRVFIVQADDVTVRVMGTSFVLKAAESSDRKFIAVSEGTVSFGPADGPEENAVILKKDMTGLYSHSKKEFISEQGNVRNYMSWMSGRIEFNGEFFPEVAKQLGYIYNVDYELTDEELHGLRLTTDISNTSMEDVLDTIAQTLELQYTIEDNTVVWKFHSKRN